MTKQQIIDQIIATVVANNNNEITADVLRPLLESMASQINDLVGALTDLSTTNKTSIVGAINEVLADAGSSGGLTIHTGTIVPEYTLFPILNVADFYHQTANGSNVALYIFNGLKWIKLDDYTFNKRAVSFDAAHFTVTPNIGVVSSVGISPVDPDYRTITIPSAMISSGREITIINDRNTGVLELSELFHDYTTGSLRTTIGNREAVTIKSNVLMWIRIN